MPVEIKGVYQAAQLSGHMGRVLPFLIAYNEYYPAGSYLLPLEPQATLPRKPSWKATGRTQMVFGENMKVTHQWSGETRHQQVAGGNCFGDPWPPRKGLGLENSREMITFCFP